MALGLFASPVFAQGVSSASMLTALNSLRPVKVVMVGDSITAGSADATMTNLGSMMSYVHMQAGLRMVDVSNINDTAVLDQQSYGVAGLTVSGLVSQTYRYNWLRDTPDAAFYWLGHNDMPATGSSFTATERRDFRERVLADLRATAVAGVVPIPLELIPTTSKDRTEILAHNAWLAGVCAQNGWPFVSGLFTVMDGQQGTLTRDGVHPNMQGYSALSAVVGAWIRANWPREYALSVYGAPQGGAYGQIGYVPPASYGTYGYGTPAGTFTTQILTQDATGIRGGALQVVKTGGRGVAVVENNWPITGVAAVGDYIGIHCRFRANGCIAGGTVLQSAWQANGGHSGAVNAFSGMIETGTEWRSFMRIYKIPAGTTSINYAIYLRQFIDANTSSTGTLEIGELQAMNLTRMRIAQNWRLP